MGADADADLGTMYLHYYWPLFRLCNRRLGWRPEEARDLVQDVWLAALRAWPAYRGECPVWDWLRAIAYRMAQDRARRAVRYKGAMAREQAGWQEAGPERPEAACIEGEEAQRIADVFATLPASYAMALRLRYTEELEIAEVAQRMGRTERAVQILLSRARERFREAYGDDGHSYVNPIMVGAYEEAIRALWQARPRSAAEIARALGLHPEYVRSELRRMGYPTDVWQQQRQATITERRGRIREARGMGTAGAIAAHLGLPVNTVRRDMASIEAEAAP